MADFPAHPVIDYEHWKPISQEQVRFLSSRVFEVLFGGAAGPGKSDCLLIGALRQIANPLYNAILFRRTFNRLSQADGLIARSQRWFPKLGGKYNGQYSFWRFPSGARIYFGHMQHLGDEQIYQGSQFCYIGFDELTEFYQQQYVFMFSRCRVPEGSGLIPMMRSATNPGGMGHEWVKERFVTKGIINQPRAFMRQLIDGKDQDVEVPIGTPDSATRVYYPARFESNPALSKDYRRSLMALTDPVERARLIEGDWEAMSVPGAIYPMWSSERNVSGDAVYHAEWTDVYWVADDGYQNPRAILLIQEDHQGNIYVLAEVYEDHKLAKESLMNAVSLSRELGIPMPQVLYHDPSAPEFASNAWSFPDPDAPLNEERNLHIYTVPADNRVVEGIKVVRQYIYDENEQVSLFVHPRCVNLIREMAFYSSDVSRLGGGSDPVPIKRNDHAPDALRYYIMTVHGSMPRGGK